MKKTRKTTHLSSDSPKNSVLSNCDSDKNKLPHEQCRKASEDLQEKHFPDLVESRLNGLQDKKTIKELIEEVNSTQAS